MSVLLAAVMVAGCAVTPEAFYRDRASVEDTPLCRTWQAAEQDPNQVFLNDVRVEAQRRGLNRQKCDELIAKQDLAIGAAILGVVVIGAAAAAAGGGGGGGGAYGASDYDWDWDQFYNQYGQLVWACRGIQTGQFAELHHCAYDVKVDTRWPGK